MKNYLLNLGKNAKKASQDSVDLDKKNKDNNYSKYLNVTTKRLKKSLHYLQNQKLSKLYSKVMLE